MEIRDSGLPPLSSTAVVTVDIEDVNDCPPLFSESSYNATVQVCKQLPHINRQTRNRPNFFLILDSFGFMVLNFEGIL